MRNPFRRHLTAADVRDIQSREYVPPGLDKAARNEIRKLRATYFNNMAIGLNVAGYLIPTISILPKLFLLSKDAVAASTLTVPVSQEITLAVLLGALTVAVAQVFRIRAERFLVLIEG